MRVASVDVLKDAPAAAIYGSRGSNGVVLINTKRGAVGINRVNIIIEKVPPLTDLEEEEKNQILGEAYAMRALHFHNVTKFWSDAPIPTVSPTSVEEAALITRSPVSEVYTQIRADLSQAEALVTATSPATQVTAGCRRTTWVTK